MVPKALASWRNIVRAGDPAALEALAMVTSFRASR
jgi:hypothetical protein